MRESKLLLKDLFHGSYIFFSTNHAIEMMFVKNLFYIVVLIHLYKFK